MPELPEVETTRRGLAPRLRGARIAGVRLGAPLRWPLGIEPARLVGLRLGELARRGKYLWLELAEAPRGPAGGLLLHLGMSGSLAWVDAATPAGRHDAFDLVTDRGMLRLTDPRRFGAVVWSAARDADPAARLLARLGREPDDPGLDAATLRAALAGRSAPIKATLLAGDIVVGAGNIYASEALHAAGIDPRTPAARIGPARAARLLAALRATFDAALGAGGSTLRNYRGADGQPGVFQQLAQVYGREGQPCRRCGSTIRRIVQAGRATYLCPGCQRR